MFVQDIMITEFQTCTINNTIQETIKLFPQMHSQIIPVIDDFGILIGIISKNKIIQLLAEGYPMNYPIKKFINRNPISLKPNYSVEDTRILLLKNNKGHAPVINDENKPIGIVSTSQILALYDKVTDRLQTQLQLLLEHLHFGIFSVDTELNVTASNLLAETFLHFNKDEPYTFTNPSSNNEITELLKGILFDHKLEMKRKMQINDHSLFVKCYPIFEKNKLIGSMVIMEDLTKLEETAKELQFSKEWEEKLRSVVELAYDGIILVNEKAEITMVNNGFCELYQVKENKILGESIVELFPELGLQDSLHTGVTVNNVVHPVGDIQSLITILPLKDGDLIVGAICKITYQGLKHLQNALHKVNKLEQQVTFYQKELNEIRGTKYSFADIIGESQQIKRAKNEAMAASKSKSTVLLLGESGTGKELFAHGIHSASQQKGMFVQVNCAAIPADLLESEFFGYAEGAFTGAKKGGKKGKFELAQNGTLFLDEIGDMSMSLQSKLLRVLQEKEFEPIGSNKTIQLNTKIIAATNQNLEKLISEGKFREDLYYRLNIMRIEIPPLRERLQDIPEIVNASIVRLNKSGFHLAGLTHSALTRLLHYNWPGNIRELQNVLERSANLTKDGYIDTVHLPELGLNQVITKNGRDKFPHSVFKEHFENNIYKETLEDTEKNLILAALNEANGNKAKASRILGISRTWLYAKIKSYNISDENYSL
ncbi:sigma 54-interacting transcriptional regulator [Neobacillus niacini]|uniref:sigma 54-interacting transcriptional regulator n=1 Tax=Neobacillus niacini TaxID=86668 RepID=UPI002FFFE05E